MTHADSNDNNTTFADLMFLLLLTILVIFVTNTAESNETREGTVNPPRSIIVRTPKGLQTAGTWRGDEVWGPGSNGDSGSTADGVIWMRQHDISTNDEIITTFFTGAVTTDGRFEVRSVLPVMTVWEPTKSKPSLHVGVALRLDVTADNIERASGANR